MKHPNTTPNAALILADLLRSVGDQPPLSDDEKARLRDIVRRRITNGV